MFVAVFVAVKRTEPTRTFLYIQLSQQISIYRGTYAHATPCEYFLKIFFCVHELYVPLLHKTDRLCLCAPCRPQGVQEPPSPLSDKSPMLLLVVCVLRVVVWISNM